MNVYLHLLIIAGMIFSYADKVNEKKFEIRFLTFLSLTILLFFLGCDIFDARLKVTSSSNKAIYYKWMPDSSFLNLYNLLLENKRMSKADSIGILGNFKQLRSGSDTLIEAMPGTWDKYFDAKKDDVIWFFIVPDSLSRSRIDNISDLRQATIKRIPYNFDYIKKHNWIINLKE
jgi:hypothetical protein